MECPFCNLDKSISKLIYEYDSWRLFLHAGEKRERLRLAAGFLATKEHEPNLSKLSKDVWAELQVIYKDAAQRLCNVAEVTYIGQETVGFNQGAESGQTINHAHVHIFPMASEDSAELKQRGGMSGAFEALYRERVKT